MIYDIVIWWFYFVLFDVTYWEVFRFLSDAGVSLVFIGVVKDVVLMIRDDGFIVKNGGFRCEVGFNFGYYVI